MGSADEEILGIVRQLKAERDVAISNQRRLLFAMVSYLMNQWRGRSKSSYSDFLEEFADDPPTKEHLPEPALGVLKEFIDDILS